MFFKLLSILFVFCCFDKSFCQNNEFKKEDTIKINSLNSLGKEQIIKGAFQKADSFINEAVVQSEKLNFEKGLLNALLNRGVVFWYQDNYPKALDSYFKALKIAEHLNNRLLISRALANIGLVYSSKKEFTKALDYYNKALKIKQDIGDKRAVAIILSNIAQIYNDKNENINALQYYEKALKIDEIVEDNKGLIALNYAGIGSVYKKQGDFYNAKEYYVKALNIAQTIKDKVLISSILINIGTLYFVQKNYEVAENSLQEALKTAIEIGDLNNKRDAYQQLSGVYEKINRWDLSLENYKKYVEVQDSIFNEDNTKKTVRLEMNFEFDKKETATKLEQDKKDALAIAENKKQQIIIWSVCAILLLVFCFAVFAYRSFLQKQKAHIAISQQKHIIEEKQKEILDSIHYAKRIQTALITSEKYFEKSLNKLNKN
jgi:tetratricopeptide (TPR) repeat protein